MKRSGYGFVSSVPKKTTRVTMLESTNATASPRDGDLSISRLGTDNLIITQQPATHQLAFTTHMTTPRLNILTL
jgi:N12 class adenine-specific DNA methylase